MTTTEQNKANFRRAWEDYYQGDLGSIYKYYHPDIIDHEQVPGQGPGLEGLLYHANVFRKAFTDNRWTVNEQVAEGDNVVTRWTLRRKHTGDFMGIPATGKEVVLTGTCSVRFSGGKVVERWSNSDALGLLRQLGIIPDTLAKFGTMEPNPEFPSSTTNH